MTDTAEGPLRDLDEWEEDLRRRYPEPEGEPLLAGDDDFRNYDDDARDGARELYRLNHTRQTLAFARAKQAEYLPLDRRRMGIWKAMEFLNTLVDDSDPVPSRWERSSRPGSARRYLRARSIPARVARSV